MSCEDILSLLDLQKVKKHADDFGRLMGTGTGTSTNGVTGQVRPTYNAVMANLGYTRVGTFASGGTLTNGRQTLLWDIADGGDGQEYGWSGAFPKVVPSASTPGSTGGISIGAWVSRFDPSLASTIASYHNSILVTSIPDVDFSGTVDNRAVLYATSGYIFIPADVTVRCNFLPTDDIRKFVGEGKILTRDQWGYEHVFDVHLATVGVTDTDTARISRAMKTLSAITIGFSGDSITDGGDGTGWTANPTGSGPEFNLSSTNYNHNANGGATSWASCFHRLVTSYAEPRLFGGEPTSTWNICANTAASGKKMIDGWAYRNFDYGFFQNTAYGNKAPDVLYACMGWNDAGSINDAEDFAAYLDQWDKFIRKCWGYGCAVSLVSVNHTADSQYFTEQGVKTYLANNYNLTYRDVARELMKFARSFDENGVALWGDEPGLFEMVHPNSVGQDFMGAAMTNLVFPDMFVKATPSTRLVPMSDRDVRCVDKNGVFLPVKQGSLGGTPWLNKIGACGVINPNNVNTLSRYYLWCEHEISATIHDIYPPLTGEVSPPRNHNVWFYNNKTYGGTQFTSEYALNQRSENTFYNTLIPRLRYGLNIVTVIHDASPWQVNLPWFFFHEGVADGFATANAFRLAGSPPGGYKGVIDYIQDDFSGNNAGGVVPDTILQVNASIIGFFNVSASRHGGSTLANGAGIEFGFKDDSLSGYKFTKVSNDVINIASSYGGAYNQNATLVGGFTNGFCVLFGHNTSTSTIILSVLGDNGGTATGISVLPSPHLMIGGKIRTVGTDAVWSYGELGYNM